MGKTDVESGYDGFLVAAFGGRIQKNVYGPKGRKIAFMTQPGEKSPGFCNMSYVLIFSYVYSWLMIYSLRDCSSLLDLKKAWVILLQSMPYFLHRLLIEAAVPKSSNSFLSPVKWYVDTSYNDSILNLFMRSFPDFR